MIDLEFHIESKANAILKYNETLGNAYELVSFKEFVESNQGRKKMDILTNIQARIIFLMKWISILSLILIQKKTMT